MIQRHSSRRNRLDRAVLNQRLVGAVSYDRIAGYFRSSLFEVAGEAINNVQGPVRIICNSDLDPQDLVTAAAAQAALRQSWCAGQPEAAPPAAMPRYQALFEALTSGRMEVRVLPDSAFGLIHGKAGVIRRADGSAISFMGSVNESLSAWKLNYELLWEDDSPESVAWVQEEFDALWNDPRAMDLACCPFIVQDVQRILTRKVIEPPEWKRRLTPPLPPLLLPSRRRSIDANRGYGRTKNTLPVWRWSAIGSAAHALFWPIRLGLEKPFSSRWRRY